MKPLLTSVLLLLTSIVAMHADDTKLSVFDLNQVPILGELGVPLHTIHQVDCKVVDMSFTGSKADDGRLAFLVVTVDGKPRDGKHYIDIPNLPMESRVKKGLVYKYWAYETVQAAGYPTEAFSKLGVPPFATTGLHFRSKLVILKTLD